MLPREAKIWSVGLHVAMGVGLVTSLTLPGCQDEDPIHVFEMVALPVPVTEMSSPVGLGVPTPPAPDLRVRELEDLRPVPDPVPDEPEAPTPPEPSTPRPPQPTPSEAPKPAKDTKPTKDTKPAETPSKMSLEEFRKVHGEPKPQKPQETKPAKAAPAPKLSTNIRDRLETTLSKSAARAGAPTAMQASGYQAGSSQEASEMGIYMGKLFRALQEVFRGEGANLSAEADIRVDARGNLVLVRIGKGSGDNLFDQAIREAVALARSPGPPPGGRAQVFTVPFESPPGAR